MQEAGQNLMPILLVIHRLPGRTRYDTVNLARMNCVAAIKFLDALHIDQHAVFCLVTDGPKAHLIVAYKHERLGAPVCQFFLLPATYLSRTHRTQMIYMIERFYVRSYDLLNAYEAFQFAVFLRRLHVYSRGLQEKLDAKADAIIDDLRTGTFRKWRMASE